jgi:hypothetical protein
MHFSGAVIERRASIAAVATKRNASATSRRAIARSDANGALAVAVDGGAACADRAIPARAGCENVA